MINKDLKKNRSEEILFNSSDEEPISGKKSLKFKDDLHTDIDTDDLSHLEKDKKSDNTYKNRALSTRSYKWFSSSDEEEEEEDEVEDSDNQFDKPNPFEDLNQKSENKVEQKYAFDKINQQKQQFDINSGNVIKINSEKYQNLQEKKPIIKFQRSMFHVNQNTGFLSQGFKRKLKNAKGENKN